MYSRATKGGAKVWYISFYDQKGRRVILSTGETSAAKAKIFAVETLKSRRLRTTRFAEYSAPFFLWGSCPHVRRLLDEGKEITRSDRIDFRTGRTKPASWSRQKRA